MKVLNKKEVEIIIQEYKTGDYSLRDLGKKYNTQRETIRYHWVRSGLKRDKKFKKEMKITRYIEKMAQRWNMTPEQFKEYMKENPKITKRLYSNDYKHKSKCLKKFLEQ
jgi:predicted DNA-binding protein YlxM (UPF0122 family)